MNSALMLAVASFAGIVALLFGLPAANNLFNGVRERNNQKKRKRKRKPPKTK